MSNICCIFFFSISTPSLCVGVSLVSMVNVFGESNDYKRHRYDDEFPLKNVVGMVKTVAITLNIFNTLNSVGYKF